VRQKFNYALPQEFPFHEMQIRKSFSGSGGFTNSQGKTSHPETEKSASNHDVDPREVLRTFTNSLGSGGTLGGLASSLTYYKEHIASKDWSNMSPSNAYQNYMFRKNLVSEV